MIRRILVAVDASVDGMAAVEASVELAASLGAELLGLYVEDQDVLHLTRFPFATEVDAGSGVPRPLDGDTVEAQLRAEGGWVRKRVERAARRRRVSCSFRTTRGRVSAEIRRAAGEVDLVVVGARSRGVWRRPGSTARALLASDARVMILRRGLELGRSVRAAWDGTDAAREAVRVAASLARARGGRLLILDVTGGTEDDARRKLRDTLREGDVPGRVRRLRGGGVGELLMAVQGAGRGVLVVPRSLLSEGPGRRRLVERLQVGAPILLVG